MLMGAWPSKKKGSKETATKPEEEAAAGIRGAGGSDKEMTVKI